jgi:polyhydroxyalkanoate synthesis regulator phasin
MSNPLVQAFFVGRAVAEVLNERLESTLTDALSELGKFDAEAREQLRSFTEDVMLRANRAAEGAGSHSYGNDVSQSGADSEDTQAMVDDLRAEIAVLRNELQSYRSSTN